MQSSKNSQLHTRGPKIKAIIHNCERRGQGQGFQTRSDHERYDNSLKLPNRIEHVGHRSLDAEKPNDTGPQNGEDPGNAG